jgi:hypothetical protein
MRSFLATWRAGGAVDAALQDALVELAGSAELALALVHLVTALVLAWLVCADTRDARHTEPRPTLYEHDDDDDEWRMGRNRRRDRA